LLPDEPERVGILVIRIWLEPAGGAVVARITCRRDLLSGDEESLVVAGHDAAVGFVRDWILAFQRDAGA